MIDFSIIFIDDNFNEMSTLVQTMSVEFPHADVSHVFNDPEKGVEYVLGNLDKPMIVFVDWNYKGTTKKGLSVLRSIREKTSLLYVIMMSANQIVQNNIKNSDIIEMMNAENFYFYDSSNDDADAVALVKIVLRKMESKFDCVLEQWLIRHPEDKNKVVIRQNGFNYTWDDVLREVRMQTEFGMDFERKANQSTIYRYKCSE